MKVEQLEGLLLRSYETIMDNICYLTADGDKTNIHHYHGDGFFPEPFKLESIEAVDGKIVLKNQKGEEYEFTAYKQVSLDGTELNIDSLKGVLLRTIETKGDYLCYLDIFAGNPYMYHYDGDDFYPESIDIKSIESVDGIVSIKHKDDYEQRYKAYKQINSEEII